MCAVVVGVAPALSTRVAGSVSDVVDRVTAVTKKVTAATEEMLGLADDRAKLDEVRRHLGAQLAVYREAAGLTQRQLAEAVDMSRCMISQVESGTRGFSEAVWAVVDAALSTGGVLLAQHGVVANAERDHQAKVRGRRSELLHSAAQLQVATTGLDSVGSDLAEEIAKMITVLARRIGRRNAVRVVFGALAAAGLAGVNLDDCERMALAVGAPQRVDARVVESFAIALAQAKRQEDVLGPSTVVRMVIAQHNVVGELLAGGVPEKMSRPLLSVQSDMANEIGSCLVDLGDHDAAQHYLQIARKAGHDARNDACASFAAATTSHTAFLRDEAHTAMDMATVARGLAGRTHDPQLKANAELHTAAAFALGGEYGRCMAAYERARQHISGSARSGPHSLAYHATEAWLDSKLSTHLSKMNRSRAAVDAARNALSRIDPRSNRRWVNQEAFATVRLGTALTLSREVDEAARVLGAAAGTASINPRLMVELRDARAGMRQWDGTRAVTTLDEQLAELDRASARHHPSSQA